MDEFNSVLGTISGVLAFGVTILGLWRYFLGPRPICRLYRFEPDVGSKGYYSLHISSPDSAHLHIQYATVVQPEDAAFWHVGPGLDRPELFGQPTTDRIDEDLPPGRILRIRFAVDDSKPFLKLKIIVRWSINKALVWPKFPVIIRRNRVQIASLPPESKDQTNAG